MTLLLEWAEGENSLRFTLSFSDYLRDTNYLMVNKYQQEELTPTKHKMFFIYRSGFFVDVFMNLRICNVYDNCMPILYPKFNHEIKSKKGQTITYLTIDIATHKDK